MARHMLLLMFKMVGARAQLRVFSAGVWHNLVLGVVAWTTSTTLPTILSPLYFSALTGSIVTSLHLQVVLYTPVPDCSNLRYSIDFLSF